MSMSDEELVVSHLNDRRGAFTRLFNRYRERLVHFIVRKTGDADRAQDLTQEAGELTPTLKVKRAAVVSKHEDEIEKLYAG